jgi:hypothetical protein
LDRLPGEVSQRGRSVAGLEDRVTMTFEERADRVTQRAIVVYHENAGTGGWIHGSLRGHKNAPSAAVRQGVDVILGCAQRRGSREPVG